MANDAKRDGLTSSNSQQWTVEDEALLEAVLLQQQNGAHSSSQRSKSKKLASSAVPAADESATTRSVRSLNSENEEDTLIVNALAALTTTIPAPFTSSASPKAPASQEQQEKPHSRQRRRGDEPSVGGPRGRDAPRAQKGASSLKLQHVSSIHESKVVLDALLEAVEYQQSSVSGDLTEVCHAGDEEDTAVEKVVDFADSITASTFHTSQKGTRILHFHEHAAIRRSLERYRGDHFGWPTCCALRPLLSPLDKDNAVEAPASDVWVAIGTSLGSILLYSKRSALLGMCVADTNTAHHRRKAVSLSLSDGAHTVASGHEDGAFILWCTRTLAPLRVVLDEFSSAVTIVQHAYLDPRRLFVLDAAGSLKMLSFISVLSTLVCRSTTLAYSTVVSDFDILPHPTRSYLRGADGVVEATDRSEVPVLYGRANQFTIDGDFIIATASSDSVLLHILECGGLQSVTAPVARHGLVTTARKGASAPLHPLVRFVLYEQCGGGAPDVRLCVSCDTDVELLSAQFSETGDLTGVVKLAYCRVSTPIQCMGPMAGCSIVMLGQNNDVILFDASIAAVVEVHTVKALNKPVVYRNPTTTSGAHARGALCVNRLSAFFLCERTALSCSVLPWNVRLKALVFGKRFEEAVDLVRDLSEEVALSSVGLHAEPSRRRQELRGYIESVAVAYLKHQLRRSSAQSCDDIHEAILRIVSFCSRADALDIFFGPVMTAIRQMQCFPEALYVMESCLLTNTVTSMPEPFIDSFVNLFSKPHELAKQERTKLELDANPASLASSEEGIARAEKALMHMETSMDHLLRIAREWRMASLSITVLSLRRRQFGKAMRAAVEMEKGEIQKHHLGANNNNNNSADIVPMKSTTSSIAMDFLACTMKGVTLIAEVSIPSSFCVKAKRQVLNSILKETDIFDYLLRRQPDRFVDLMLQFFANVGSYSPWSDGDVTGDETSSSSPSMPSFYSLKGGLALFFSLLTTGSRCNHDALFGDTQCNDSHAHCHQPIAQFRPWRVSSTQSFPPYKTIAQFLSGLSSLFIRMSKKERLRLLPTSNHYTHFINVLVEHYVYAFQVADDSFHRVAIQNELNKLLLEPFATKSGRGDDDNLAQRYIGLFEKHRMVRCVAALHARSGKYLAAIACYLDHINNLAEPKLKYGVFAFLRGEVSRLTRYDGTKIDTGTPVATRKAKHFANQLRRAVVSNVTTLVQVDAASLAQFVSEFLPAAQGDTVKLLDDESSLVLLTYLDGLMAQQHQHTDDAGRDTYAVVASAAAGNDVNLQKTYIELLCAYRPQQVYPYLKENDECISYDVQLALRAAKRYNIVSATVYLLGKTLLIDESIEVLKGALHAALKHYREGIISNLVLDDEHGGDSSSPLSASISQGAFSCDTSLQCLVEVGIDVCAQFQLRTCSSDVGHWFQLMDVFTHPYCVLSTRQKQHDALMAQQTNEKVECCSSSDGWELCELLDPNDASVHPDASPQRLSGRGQVFVSRMMSLYKRYISHIFHAILRAVDLNQIIARIQEGEQEGAAAAYDDVLCDLQVAVRCDVEINRLFHACSEEDLSAIHCRLSIALHAGIAPRSDTCNVCGHLVREKPSVYLEGSSTSTVRYYACGHGIHEACILAGAPQPPVDTLHRQLECQTCRVHQLIRESTAPHAKGADLQRNCRALSSRPVTTHGTVKTRRLDKTRSGIEPSVDDYQVLKACISASDRRHLSDDTSELKKLVRRLDLGGTRDTTGIGISTGNGSAPTMQKRPLDVLDKLTDDDMLELFGQL